MRLSSEHDPKYLRLGLILVFTGFLFALIFVTRVNARELSPQIYDSEAVLVYESDPLAVYGCDHALYFYPDPVYSDYILLSSVFNPEVEQLYDYWYGSQVMSSVRSWGFNPIGYDVLKGHIINLMSRTNTFWISRYDTISNVELKELVLDDSYVAFYFMDSNFNYYCYVSYIPVNSETVQPEYPFDSFTINDSGHFIEQDPLYRELFVWDLSNQRWVYSSVSPSDVVVHTVLRSPSGVRLESGAQVYVQSSRFLIDEPLPSSTPIPTASPSPIPELERSSIVFHAATNQYFLIDFYGENVGNTSVIVPSNSVLQSLQTEYNSIDDVAVNSVFLSRSRSGGTYYNYINLWFNAETLDEVKIYFLNSAPVDLDYVRDTVSPQSFFIQTVADGFNDSLNRYYQAFDSSWSGYLAKDGTTLKRFCIALRYYYNTTLSWGVDSVLGSLSTYFFSLALDSDFTGDRPFSWSYGSTQYGTGLRYQIDFSEHEFPYVTPSPSPSPTPTEAPHVIVVWPTGTPTPTPPFVIPSVPPLNPPGNGITPLDPELQEDVFGVFKSKIGDNNSFGLFGLLIGLLPGDLMWYIWFLLFVLLVVGIAKLIIHFTGG